MYRLWRQAALQVPRKRPRRRGAASRPRPLPPTAINHVWAYDFVFDTCADGRSLKCLTIIDEFTRECLAIEVDTSLPGGRVVRVLERLAVERGAPDEIVLDNGPELAGKAVDQWAYERGVQLRFIEPGKPVQNAFVESFHGRLRDECLDRHWFLGLGDARQTVEAWRDDYNRARPHSALGYRPPAEFRRIFEESTFKRQELTGLSE